MRTATRPAADERTNRTRPPQRSRRTRALDTPPAPAPRRIRLLIEDGSPARELIVRDGSAGSRLLIDRDAADGSDERLIAHLAPDEPPTNIALLCGLYADARPDQRRCRAVTEQDLLTVPFGNRGGEPAEERREEVVAGPGFVLRLERLESRMSIPELRWTSAAAGAARRPVSLRECIAMLEDYEPLNSLTRSALAGADDDPTVSTTTLRAEFMRVLESPIVLNRALREAVLERIERHDSSLSEIATRCGRVKRDSRGNQSGETSWLARRIGILPEGGQREPTVWVHSDVLALIAREGLGISPREVELG
jgi:hypothetical protein